MRSSRQYSRALHRCIAASARASTEVAPRLGLGAARLRQAREPASCSGEETMLHIVMVVVLLLQAMERRRRPGKSDVRRGHLSRGAAGLKQAEGLLHLCDRGTGAACTLLHARARFLWLWRRPSAMRERAASRERPCEARGFPPAVSGVLLRRSIASIPRHPGDAQHTLEEVAAHIAAVRQQSGHQCTILFSS